MRAAIKEEARTLYEILQDHVIPLYYERERSGYSPEWVKLAKRSIATLMPRFNSERMLAEYIAKCYRPAAQQGRRYAGGPVRSRTLDRRLEVARVRSAWPGVSATSARYAEKRIDFGETRAHRSHVESERLDAGGRGGGVAAEPDGNAGQRRVEVASRFVAQDADAGGAHRYALELAPEYCGRLDVRIRAYPCSEYLTHPLELGLMVWA